MSSPLESLTVGLLLPLLPRLFTGPGNLNLFGWRSTAALGSDRFDDVLGALYQDERGAWVLRTWAATTDPGRSELDHPRRPEGAAVLQPGHYVGCWAPGLHHGETPALTQRAPMRFWRWRDGALKASSDQLIGCNLHAANGGDRVGSWSAGCQVLQRPEDLAELLALVEAQRARGLGSRVSYTLLSP